MIFFLSLVIFGYFLCVPGVVLAENNSFVTIVNPVRISPYNNTPVESLKAEYIAVQQNNLPATWLLTFDVIKNLEMVSLIKSFNSNHELGIFLEISEEFCINSDVYYDNSFSWHHAANIFLTGYVQNDRKKLIDTVFENFKNNFGYYPKSVGGWWIDAFSLNYMQQKYGITANLSLADQYSTDGYKVWGVYWSAPFYSNRMHAGIPASSKDNKIDVVNMQWAPRDPLNGYSNSYYSTQDYLQGPVYQDISYFENLITLYSTNPKAPIGHVVVGLESDLSPISYKGEYSNQLQTIGRLVDINSIKVSNMTEFANYFKEKFPEETPVSFVESLDLLGKEIKTLWFNSPSYRIGINYNLASKEVEIFDFRVYTTNYLEPYYYSPNKDFRLLIDIPSVVDKFTLGNSWKLNLGELVEEIYIDSKTLSLVFRDGKILLDKAGIKIVMLGELEIPKHVLESSLVNVQNGKELFVKPISKFKVDENGYVFSTLKPEIKNLLKTKRAILIEISFIVFLLVFAYFLGRSKLGPKIKILMVVGLMGILVGLSEMWLSTNVIRYYVSQAEIDALNHLSFMKKGKVMVYDNQCFGCSWNSPYKPAAFDNMRNYVERFSNMKIVYNKSVFEADNQKIAREEFDKTETSYIYIVNYENYKEKVPFSPGDLEIELIYENANAQLWRKVNEN